MSYIGDPKVHTENLDFLKLEMKKKVHFQYLEYFILKILHYYKVSI